MGHAGEEKPAHQMGYPEMFPGAGCQLLPRGAIGSELLRVLAEGGPDSGQPSHRPFP